MFLPVGQFCWWKPGGPNLRRLQAEGAGVVGYRDRSCWSDGDRQTRKNDLQIFNSSVLLKISGAVS